MVISSQHTLGSVITFGNFALKSSRHEIKNDCFAPISDLRSFSDIDNKLHCD